MLKKSCYSYLDQVVAILKENPDAVINIDGYADITGKPRVNAKISKERATAVKKFLVKMGIAPARLETTGHGSSSPVASNRTRAGRAQNRRVTINLKYSLQ